MPQVADITWLGEDENYGEEGGPRRVKWKNITFEIGKSVTVGDPHLIEKAKGSQFFKVENEREVDKLPEPEAPPVQKAPHKVEPKKA